MTPSQRKRRRLVFVLRLIAIGDLAAVAAVFLPASVLSIGHEWLGLGPLPDAPIVGYLARSTSILYSLHGATLLFVSRDVDRYEPVIRFLAIAIAACGSALWIVDQFEDLPLWWRLGEGPLVIGLGVAIWWANRSYQREPNALASGG